MTPSCTPADTPFPRFRQSPALTPQHTLTHLLRVSYQAFLDWRALDAELAEAGFRSHSDIVSGAAPAPTTDDYQRFNGTPTSAAPGEGGDGNSGSTGAPTSSLPRPPQLPLVSCVEWLRRGMLAERLHHEADALAAYQAAVMTPPPLPAAAAVAFDGGGALFACLPSSGPGAFSMIAWEVRHEGTGMGAAFC